MCALTPSRPDVDTVDPGGERVNGTVPADIKVKEQSIENIIRCAACARVRRPRSALCARALTGGTAWPARPSMRRAVRNRKVYEPPRYMTIAQCIDQLLEVEARRGEGGACTDLVPTHTRDALPGKTAAVTLTRPPCGVRATGTWATAWAAYSADTLAVGLARVGADNQQVWSGPHARLKRRRRTHGQAADTELVGRPARARRATQIVVGTLTELRTVDFGAPLHTLIIAGRVHVLERDLLRFYEANAGTVDKHADIA